MNLRSVRQRFLDRVRVTGADLTSLTPDAGFELMLRFYAEERVAHCPPDEDGDVLVFQWGVYDWGDGERFELNVTRQLMTAAGDGDEDVRHLALTFRYPTDPALDAVGDGQEVCDDPADVGRFRAAVFGSKPFKAAADRAPAAVDLAFDQA